MGKCPLCKKEAVLKESHVIPKTFFRRLKKVKNQAIQTDLQYNTPFYKTQDSWSEKLLCSDCEQKIGKYDAYIASFTYNPQRVGILVDKNNSKFRVYQNIDYKKFRLFQLSLLYRAALSNHVAYQHIKLFPKDLEKIRKAIISEKPINNSKFGCIMILLWNYDKDEPFNHTIAVPKKSMLLKKEIIRFVFGGFAWEFHLPKLNGNFKIYKSFLKKAGTLKVLIIDFIQYPFYTAIGIKAQNSKSSFEE